MEDIPQALEAFRQNYWIWIFMLMSIFSVAINNTTNVSVTKFSNCVQKTTINASKTGLVWIFFLAYPGKGHERFIWLQVVGFVILLFGIVMYSHNLFGMNESTITNLESISEKQAMLDLEESFTSDSKPVIKLNASTTK